MHGHGIKICKAIIPEAHEQVIIRMIAETEQAKGVEVIVVDEMGEDEEVPRDMWAKGKHEEEV